MLEYPVKCPSCGQPLRIKDMAFEDAVFVDGQDKVPHEFCGGWVPEEIVMVLLLTSSDQELREGLDSWLEKK
jgi:hypothetical protein